MLFFYRVYKKVVDKDNRGPKDPNTPNIDIPTTQRAWDDRYNSWKDQIHTWHSTYEKSLKILREPSVKDYDNLCQMGKLKSFLNWRNVRPKIRLIKKV